LRAVVLGSQPWSLRVDGDWPEPVAGSGQVIVRVRGVGICGSDLALLSGRRSAPTAPWIPGHEAFGSIVAAGGGVPAGRIGQRVVIEPNFPCRSCAACRAGLTSACQNRVSLGFSAPGVLADLIAIPAEFAWEVPADWADEDAVCTEPLTVALAAMRRAGVPRPGSGADSGPGSGSGSDPGAGSGPGSGSGSGSGPGAGSGPGSGSGSGSGAGAGSGPGVRCLVIGAGSQGLLLCTALVAAGMTPHVLEPHEGRRSLAASLGAIPAGPGDDAFGVIFETSGSAGAMTEAIGRAAPGATVVLIGLAAAPVPVDAETVVRRQLRILGSLTYDHPDDFAVTIKSASGPGLRPGRVLRACYPLEDAQQAFRNAREVPGKTWIRLS
jgi:threonine dehydrogenase-like Zn-dependent dehydrogenase